ncbi:HlyD family efflux transporter periplasmic adaptor subunit [Clostridium celatum]|uniref:Efflux transporter, RND family, MFP subunit n=1 Tax=Clostridium celatum DSM 1785 TaxID=545697 RepID=L1QHP2_9CLOT|nr:HlyD family efflux transporter periplasmic adaptor subunit [Clostridium celatum]EKY27446.1 efflux transporter, RND family, MFP subunit [Clostridium celatum DSM 1785]MCE9656818.1 HlyD family efflux transporter periplasmic adaptor subunit [Clostridium celatum]MDU2266836.1 HlyD family efflux transporter periplasmic adaptor subunit [Clostridium celatum]MDU6297327.1 HlyD family efflux transporter periplasmic adaptor subunit [Clostridium celatum]
MNEKIKKIINYKYVKKGKDTLQKKALKSLVAFLFVMIICTMLSRFADSLTIPVITTENPKTKTIVDEVKASGRIVKSREEKISIVEGLKIDYVNVSLGSTIKVGDTLVELNIDDLNNKISELRENVEKEEKTIARAIEDYNKAIESKNQSVTTALNELNAAEKALNDYAALKDEEKDPMTQESLNADYENKKAMYNQVVSEANDTTDLDRNLQDIKDSVDTEKYYKEIEKLQPLIEAKGLVKSDREGIVTSVFAESGGVTSDTIISIADKNSGYKFIAQIEKDKRSTVKQGQEVALTLNNSQTVDKLTIEAIANSTENPGYLDITVILPVGIGEIDDMGELIISSTAKKYGTCVPLAALRQGENNNYYVLAVSEKETVLGTEKVAKKIEVRVEKKDGEFAAISDGTIARNEQVIVGSNKTVEDGDRVRLETE